MLTCRLHQCSAKIGFRLLYECFDYQNATKFNLPALFYVGWQLIFLVQFPEGAHLNMLRR